MTLYSVLLDTKILCPLKIGADFTNAHLLVIRMAYRANCCFVHALLMCTYHVVTFVLFSGVRDEPHCICEKLNNHGVAAVRYAWSQG